MGTYVLLYNLELILVSDRDDRTSFLVSVYKKSHVPLEQGEVVGCLTNIIGGIFAKSNNDGTKILCVKMSCFTDAISSDHSARSASWRRYFRSA